jgi:hypothetical protein
LAKNRDHSRSLWVVLATLVIAAVAAGATLVGVLRSGGDGGARANPTSLPTVTSSRPPSPTPPATSSLTPPPTPPLVLAWHRDKVHFPYQSGITIDGSDPKVTSGAGDFTTGNFGNDSLPAFSLYGSAGSFNGRNPSLAQCEEALRSSAVSSSFTTRVGHAICVQSRSQSSMAAITVLAWDSRSWGMDAAVTIWQTG